MAAPIEQLVDRLDRRHFSTQNELAQDQAELNRVVIHSRKVEACDGTPSTRVRTYLKELELVPLEIRYQVFEYTARGELREEGTYYAEQHPDNWAWPEFKNHLLRAFVTRGTDETLRTEIYKITKQPYESVVSYNRRFRNLVNEVFPRILGADNRPLPRGPDQTEILLKAYAKGLGDARLQKKMVSPTWPETLEVALERTARTERQRD
jgi:hypothetical protein